MKPIQPSEIWWSEMKELLEAKKLLEGAIGCLEKGDILATIEDVKRMRQHLDRVIY